MLQPLKLNRLIYLLAVLKFIFPFLIQNSIYEPHRDEFLYLAEGRHLAWGYLEVPPLMSVMAGITDALGGGLFWIRLWPSLFRGADLWVVRLQLILLLGGKGFALLLGFLPFVFRYLVHVHYIFQPNFLEVFFWTTMTYGLALAVTPGSQSSHGLYIAGISWGLGMMSKYSVAFFAIALLLGLLLTKERRLLRNKHFLLCLSDRPADLPSKYHLAGHTWFSYSLSHEGIAASAIGQCESGRVPDGPVVIQFSRDIDLGYGIVLDRLYPVGQAVPVYCPGCRPCAGFSHRQPWEELLCHGCIPDTLWLWGRRSGEADG